MNRLLPTALLKQVISQVEHEYPRESCGLILGSVDPETWRIQPVKNMQDILHAQDPIQFPRTSQTAYFMDPEKLLKVHKEMRDSGEAIRMIYHSHIDAAASFSEEDKRMAIDEGEPLYPGTAYVIFSVRSGKVTEQNVFRWEADQKAFVKIT